VARDLCICISCGALQLLCVCQVQQTAPPRQQQRQLTRLAPSCVSPLTAAAAAAAAGLLLQPAAACVHLWRAGMFMHMRRAQGAASWVLQLWLWGRWLQQHAVCRLVSAAAAAAADACIT
jgi:hypothetical protein